MKFISVLSVSLLQLAGANALANMGCSEQDYVAVESGARIEITGRGYTPRCLIVEVGSEVMIAASERHPLAPQQIRGNPIPETEESVAITFSEVGEFGYFCTDHGDQHGEGMAGSVRVVDSQ